MQSANNTMRKPVLCRSLINRDSTQPIRRVTARDRSLASFDQLLHIKAVGILLSPPQLEGVVLRLRGFQNGFNRQRDVRCLH